MKRPFRKCVLRLGGDQRGATAVEYGLIVSIIVIGVVGAVSSLGGGVFGMWNHVVDSFADVG